MVARAGELVRRCACSFFRPRVYGRGVSFDQVRRSSVDQIEIGVPLTLTSLPLTFNLARLSSVVRVRGESPFSSSANFNRDYARCLSGNIYTRRYYSEGEFLGMEKCVTPKTDIPTSFPPAASQSPLFDLGTATRLLVITSRTITSPNRSRREAGTL